MSTAQVIPIEGMTEKLSKIRAQASNWELAATELVVSSRETLEIAGTMLHDLKALLGTIDKECDPNIAAAYKLHRDLVAQKKRFHDPLLTARDEIRRKVARYTAEQERLAREQAALEAAVAREAQEKAEADARELEEMGETELAKTVREEGEIQAAPAAVREVPMAQGVVTREIWKAEVVDKKAFIAAVAAGTIPLAAVQPVAKVIGQQARSLKTELRWPGVRVWSEKSVVTR